MTNLDGMTVQYVVNTLIILGRLLLEVMSNLCNYIPIIPIRLKKSVERNLCHKIQLIATMKVKKIITEF